MSNRELLMGLLDRARWAPSGDNTQPWRFEIVSDKHIAIHGHDTRDWCLYDFQGHASHMAHGALLETLRIAATVHGLRATWRWREGTPDDHPIYDVTLEAASTVERDPLESVIESRTVQRRPMRLTPLNATQRRALSEAAGDDFQVQLFETWEARWAVAKLLWRNAHIRLTCPEAYEVHKEIIEWGARFSADRIPERAVGVDWLTARLMRWVMGNWGRVQFFNQYLMGTVAPRVQLDLIPAMACAAHLLLRPKQALEGLEAHLRLGAAMQRVWLTAAAEGLHLQPEMTPVIFRWYARAGQRFSASDQLALRAGELAAAFEAVAGAGQGDEFGFFCRVGVSGGVEGRSTRLGVDGLMVGGKGLGSGS
ncbi:MAG: nitroreductase family protein [Rhodocyclaceae bacterium]|nr:nitroreductase family protein [Rhodocyclaceae bacterium]